MRNTILFAMLAIFASLAVCAMAQKGDTGNPFSYEGFQITGDRFLIGTVTNTSKYPRRGISVDISAVNQDESEVHWSTTVSIGTLKPGESFKVKEFYGVKTKDPERFKFQSASTVFEEEMLKKPKAEEKPEEEKKPAPPDEGCSKIDKTENGFNISGKGDCVSEWFDLEADFIRWDISHKGRAKFTASLISRNETRNQPLASGFADYTGTKEILLKEEGEYSLEIKADGAWGVSITVGRKSSPKIDAEKKKIDIKKGKDGSMSITNY